jgi:hypothetical protein
MEELIQVCRIPYKWGQTVKLKTLWDIHFGNMACDVKSLKKFVDDDESYFMGGGDWIDSIVLSDSKRYTKSGDATQGDDIIDEAVNGLYDILSPVRDRLLGVGSGNHEQTIQKRAGTHPTKRLAKMLGVPFRGYSWFLPVVMEDGKRAFEIDIKNHHGFGGGRTLGADLTRYYQDLAPYDASIYCFGHTHQKHWTPVDRFSLTKSSKDFRKLTNKEQHIVVCGTFLKTFLPKTDATYGEEKGYRPVSVGNMTINLKPGLNDVKIWVER